MVPAQKFGKTSDLLTKNHPMWAKHFSAVPPWGWAWLVGSISATLVPSKKKEGSHMLPAE